MSSDRPEFSVLMKYHFGKPQALTWSYPIMVMTILLMLFYVIRCFLPSDEAAIPATSLIGFSIFVPIVTIFCLVLPSLYLMKGHYDVLVGRYAGVGVLVTSFLSGVPLMLISVSIYNIFAWLWLHTGASMVYPAFLYFGGTETASAKVLSILTDTVIPGFGACLFFFGVLWSRFRSGERLAGYIIIGLTYALYGLDFINFPSLFIIGFWCAFVRSKSMSLFGPFLCLIGCRLTDLLLAGTLSRVDIMTTVAYSDIDPTYLYASLPSLFIGLILLSFFMRILTDFNAAYATKEEDSEYDSRIPSFDRGLNLSIVLSAVLMIILWVMLFKGVHL
ncbi:MAG: hypothetical protein IKT14_08480 [Clostridiales bacterium]|nr:hypothetical protein [Clostridiales bacterium]MBR6485043.1 hypothetical protein [Clostridiales bacterium]